ncbi:MAG: hypothetical protein H0W85_09880 [Methylotenera sp.]|nr:hypothetical protein [Methylotenera sp.]
MQEYQEWQELTLRWSKSLSKARIKEAVIADRMNSFLKGNGCLPTTQDLKDVEELWRIHVEYRNALNNYVAEVIKRNESK